MTEDAENGALLADDGVECGVNIGFSLVFCMILAMVLGCCTSVAANTG